MENLPGKFKKAVKTCRLPEQAKRRKQWTMLLVEDCGKTIRIRGFRAILISWLFLFLLSAGTAAFYYYRFTDAVSENQKLAGLLQKNAQGHPITERAKTDPSAASEPGKEKMPQTSPAPLQEEEKENISENIPETAAENNPENNPKNNMDTPSPSVPQSEEKKLAETVAEPAPENAGGKSETVISRTPESARVSVDDFACSFSQSSGELDIRFNIRNADPDAGPVSGEIFLLLQPEKSSRKQILVPDGNMKSGKPSQDAKGEGFSISRFKSVDMQAKGIRKKEDFKTARVLIYDDDRHILLEQDMEIVIE